MFVSNRVAKHNLTTVKTPDNLKNRVIKPDPADSSNFLVLVPVSSCLRKMATGERSDFGVIKVPEITFERVTRSESY